MMDHDIESLSITYLYSLPGTGEKPHKILWCYLNFDQPTGYTFIGAHPPLSKDVASGRIIKVSMKITWPRLYASINSLTTVPTETIAACFF